MLLFLGLVCTAYLMLMWFYLHSWVIYPLLHMREIPKDARIAVLIPARNESANIAECLLAISQQNLPKLLMREVIVIDDHSTDGTTELALGLQMVLESAGWQLKVLALKDYAGLLPEDVAFKKRALEYALQNTSANLIITTDADCFAPPNWLATILPLFSDKRIHFVAAPVLFHRFEGFLGHFQALDFCGTMGITAAGIGQRWQYMANGANLAFRRAALDLADGYTQKITKASGDDMFLIQAIAAIDPYSIAYAKSQDAVVYTLAQSSYTDFLMQRLRWGTKTTSYKALGTQIALTIAYVMCMIIFCAVCALIYEPTPFRVWILAVLFVVKALADYPLLASTTTFFGQKRLITWFLPSLVLHTLYVAVVGTMSIFMREYQWKGRKVR
jgi:cellulose synthase/poly-beta-1,6-N-acetylglucosamine synthase-like glycosyltransferase